MHLSKKAEYALRALLAIARHKSGQPCLIEDLSESERIPMKFLEQILLALKRAELLKSKRGVGGGYQLNRSAAEISLGEIITVLDGPFQPISCTATEPAKFGGQRCECGVLGGCGLGKTLTDLQLQVNKFLHQTTLADVLAREAKVEMSFDI